MLRRRVGAAGTEEDKEEGGVGASSGTRELEINSFGW